MNAEETKPKHDGSSGARIVGAAVMLVGFLIQLDIFEWILNILVFVVLNGLGWLLMIIGAIIIFASFGNSEGK